MTRTPGEPERIDAAQLPTPPTKKRGKVTSPTQRSLAYLRAHGWLCHIVERWNAFAKVRQDVYGFGDILACHPVHGIALVQTTTATNLAARRKKIAAEGRAARWLVCGGKILLHGWSQRGPVRGWDVTEEWVQR